MRGVKLIITVLLLMLSGMGQQAVSAPRSDEDVRAILERLDGEIERRDVYISARQRSIDSLRNHLRTSPRDLEAWERLGRAYTSFDNDSAINVIDHAQRLAAGAGDSIAALRLRLRRASLLPLAGFVHEAITDYNSIDTTALTRDDKILYFSRGRQMYSYISSYYYRFPDIFDHYFRQSLDAQLKLLQLLDESHPEYLLNQGEYYYLTGNYPMASALITQLVDSLPEEDNRYARATHILADIARHNGDINDYIYQLARSAISDTRSATLEVTSLQELGQMMFQQDDIERAHKYLYVALRSAVECNADTRMIQIAEALPLIEEVHQRELQSSRRRIYIAMAVMAVALIALIAALLFLRKKMRQMRQLQQHLQRTNRIKEEYITQFLNLCSIYMDKLNQLCRIANRKISSGQVEELYKLTKSGKFIENQSKEFYDVFDNAFIHIYPGFVDSVNALLQPDKQIVVAPGEILNTDLRILAFMRLGIDDSARIAQILNYSINTIYTYRNKLKNRAINRDTFENDVMHIRD